MKKIDLGQTISILANVGVVAGLILLALQLSQANRRAEADTYQTRISEIEQARREFAGSEHLPGIYVKLNDGGLESLTSEELSRLRSWEVARMLRMQGQNNQYEEGFLDSLAIVELEAEEGAAEADELRLERRAVR